MDSEFFSIAHLPRPYSGNISRLDTTTHSTSSIQNYNRPDCLKSNMAKFIKESINIHRIKYIKYISYYI